MKRSSIVVVVLIAAITAMIWAGVMAYRIRKSLGPRPAMPSSAMPSSAMSSAAMSSAMTQPGTAGTAAADLSSPAAQGLPDLRGKPAPGFTLKTPQGKTVSLSDYKGKAVLLNFWATWCGPCKLEMPWLIDLQKKYAAQGFTVLGISEDDGAAKDVSDFASKIGVNYPILLANEKVSNAYGGIDYLPTSYYIGRDGKVMMEVGGIISQDEIAADIQKILATKGA